MSPGETKAQHSAFGAFFKDALLDRLEAANRRLATSPDVPNDVEKLLLDIANKITKSSERDFDQVDPYLRIAFQRGLTTSLLGLTAGAKRDRTLLRIGIEQMRQAVRDLLEGTAVRDEVPLKERVRWLAEVLHITQLELAELLRTNQRQIQRWLSEADPAEPRGDDAWRVDLVGKIVNHLRHVLTAQGVFYWFESPHPDLKGAAPADLLEEPSENAAYLLRLASGARSHGAS